MLPRRFKIPQLILLICGTFFVFIYLYKIVPTNDKGYQEHIIPTQSNYEHTNPKLEQDRNSLIVFDDKELETKLKHYAVPPDENSQSDESKLQHEIESNVNFQDTTVEPKCYTLPNENTQSGVDVNVNDLQKFQGFKINNELYVPFTFLSKYFDIFGKFIDPNHFKWYHVNPALINMSSQYDGYSIYAEYLSFQKANVPKRARVKCICGRYEIPITTQWDPKGYYYPIQVAQYGLSHLSKYHVESKERKKKRFKLKGNSISGSRIRSGLFILKLKFKLNHCSFNVKVVASDGNKYTLSYVTDNTMIGRKGSTIVHGIGEKFESEDKVITRDLNSDILKGLSYQEGKRNGKTVLVSVKSIQEINFQKGCDLEEVVLLDVDHKSKFLSAANWFVKFQDDNGGWKVNISRIIRQGMSVKPGWYSSMGQGQAISLLTRVYLITREQKYLQTALKATKVFHRMSKDNGVRADLFGTPWYEEYPTEPASFVLNGFIYSLFGLYDLWKIAGDEQGSDASILFKDGFKSLETRIPLYDNGHNTFYDLRHLTMPGISPNRARWQYHQVHLEQLHALINITKSTILSNVFDRWKGYLSGILSRHN